MALAQSQINEIENVLRTALRNKFLKYKPEPAAMPFHTRLLGKDRLALYAFIHSLNMNFGTSVFESCRHAGKVEFCGRESISASCSSKFIASSD